MSYSSAKPYIYTCEQKQVVSGTVSYTPVLLDDTTTVIDGGKIITGSVTANALNASNINASKTLTIGAFKESAQNDILNSNIQVGGRNLLRIGADGSIGTSSSASGATCTITGPTTILVNGERTNASSGWLFSSAKIFGGYEIPAGSYLLWCDNELVRLRVGTGDNAAFLVSASMTRESPYTLTLSTPTAVWVTPYVDSVGTSFSSETVHVMLERGNKATDWTPAPEDVDSAIDDASKVADNYIYADSTGIRIASANPSAQKQRIQLTSDRVDFYNANDVSIGAISGNVARFGPLTSGHINIDGTNGIAIYDSAAKKRAMVNTSGLTIYDANENDVANFGSTVGTTGTTAFARVGRSNSSRFEISPTTLSAYTGNTKYFEVSATGMTYGSFTAASTADIDAIEIGGTNLLQKSSTLIAGSDSNGNSNATVDGGYGGAVKQIETTSA